MGDELVSVVVPTYYRSQNLQRALRSVWSQTYSPVEIIVVDDSGEAYAEETVDGDVQYVALDENNGPSTARNVGIDAADGSYVKFLDDDDWLGETAIEALVTTIESDPEADVAYCGIQYPDRDVLPDTDSNGDVLKQALSFRPSTWRTSTLLVDADLDVWFDESFQGGEDIAYRIELACETRFTTVERPLLESEHGGELGTSWGAVDDRWAILEKYADLYDAQPVWVRKSALADTYQHTGRRHLEDHVWSPRAIVAFAKALYHHPNPDTATKFEFLTSFGGRPLRDVAASVKDSSGYL